MVVGIALSYSAVLIPQIETQGEIPDSENKTLTSLVASIIVLMVPLGSIMAGYLMDRIGRVNTIKFAAVPSIIGWILIATAPSIYWILAGRIFTGIACAVGSSPAIVYITEVARSDLRGSLISAGPTIASLGKRISLLSIAFNQQISSFFVAGMVLTYIEGAIMNWRLVSWIAIVLTILPIILIQMYVPESPVFLVSKGRIEDAAASLKFLYKNYPQPDHTEESIADIHLKVLIRDKERRLAANVKVSALGETQQVKHSKWAEFKKPTGYKPLIILFFFFLIQQFSGIYITLFFSVSFLMDVGSGGIDPFVASIFLGVVRFVFSCFNAYLLRRFKRRFLVMVSSFCMAVCMFCSGVVTIWISEGAIYLNFIPVLCLLLFVCSSMIGLLTIPWTMTAELFPTDIRGIGHSICFSMANCLMFLAVQSYRTLLEILGPHGIQWFFSFISIVGFFYALIWLPETHGKKLSEIEAYFQKKTPTTRNQKNITDIYNVSANNKEIEKMLKNKELA